MLFRSRSGAVLSDQATVSTRMHKINDATLEVNLVIEDPKALTKPWLVTKRFRKNPKPFQYMYDYGCAENNRNPADPATGKTLMLGPDGKPLN